MHKFAYYYNNFHTVFWEMIEKYTLQIFTDHTISTAAINITPPSAKHIPAHIVSVSG